MGGIGSDRAVWQYGAVGSFGWRSSALQLPQRSNTDPFVSHEIIQL